jgi:hypothetical protein
MGARRSVLDEGCGCFWAEQPHIIGPDEKTVSRRTALIMANPCISLWPTRRLAQDHGYKACARS